MILVLVEAGAAGPAPVSLEALTFARGLADDVQAVLIGAPPGARGEILARLGEYGVRTVHAPTDARLSTYAAAAWAAAFVDVAESTGADGMITSGSPRGNEILAHTATRLGVAMAANVVGIEESAPLVVRRQVLGGAAHEVMRLDDRVAVFSLAGHACEPIPAMAPVSTEVIEHSPAITDTDLLTRVVRVEAGDAADTGALTSARVVVGGGRGVGGTDGFGDLLELAELLGGALGVSRVVTSLGWRPHAEQVGQTGSRISPDVYLACGISGAIQHWAGCQSAKTIIAINTDSEAPMVTKADYAVIGDLHEIVPAINAELRKRASSSP